MLSCILNYTVSRTCCFGALCPQIKKTLRNIGMREVKNAKLFTKFAAECFYQFFLKNQRLQKKRTNRLLRMKTLWSK